MWTGHALDPKVIGLMDHLLEPAPTWTSFFAKPSSLIKIIYQALPFIIRARISVTWPGVLSFLQAIRSSPPPFPTTSSLKVGAAGFCWGGRHAINLSHDDPATRVASPETTEPQRLVDAVFTHPSMLRLPRDIEKVRVPTSVAIGDVDAVVKAKDALEMKRILDDKDGHEMRIEPGAKHGFSIRMHPEDEHEMECAERAEKQAISWFNKQLV